MDDEIHQAFTDKKNELPTEPVALLVESPGGTARCAYIVARLLKRRCGDFTAVVGNWAKSAATLLCLGAREIIMAEHGELGPLDAQFYDNDREQHGSALADVQALERLNAAAMEMVDSSMMLLIQRTSKKTDRIIPNVLKYVADLMRPLFENIDAIQYSQRSRMLKVAEEVRLLNQFMPMPDARGIARRLVEKYPEHPFVIDAMEARQIGLPIKDPTEAQAQILDALLPYLRTETAIGRVVAA